MKNLKVSIFKIFKLVLIYIVKKLQKMLLGKPKLSNSQLKEKIRNERFIEKNLNSIKLGTIQSFTLEILRGDTAHFLTVF